MSTQYLKAAVEILTHPTGPSIGMVEGAIVALQAHVDVVRRRAGEISLEDRLVEAMEIERAERWAVDDLEPVIEDEDGELAYLRHLENQAEMHAMRDPAWGHEEYL